MSDANHTFHTKLAILLTFVNKDQLCETLTVKYKFKSAQQSLQMYLKKPEKIPHPKTLENISEAAGFSENIFEKNLSEFIEIFHKKSLPFVRDLNKSYLPRYEAIYKGYYYCWFYWVNASDSGHDIYKSIIKISEIDDIKGQILCSMSTFNHITKFDKSKWPVWGYHGVLSPVVTTKCLFFAFENADKFATKVGYTTLQMRESHDEKKVELWGIYTAEPAEQVGYTSVPTSTRVFMRKINGDKIDEKSLMEELKWITEKEAKNDSIDIAKLKNEVDNNGVLSIS